MRRIYDLLPPSTQAHYDRLARLQFSGCLLLDLGLVAPPEVSLDAPGSWSASQTRSAP